MKVDISYFMKFIFSMENSLEVVNDKNLIFILIYLWEV